MGPGVSHSAGGICIQSLYSGVSFQGFLVLAQFESCDNWVCDFSSAAILFVTSPSSCVCKSLHIWKHSQQGVSAGDHCRIRWVRGNLHWVTCCFSFLFLLGVQRSCHEKNKKQSSFETLGDFFFFFFGN